MEWDASKKLTDCPHRLAALHESELLDTPPEKPFDRITALAARVLKAPVALVSLVDADRQFFKSIVGLCGPAADARQTPLSHSFCRHVVDHQSPLLIDDAHDHPDFRHNGAVADLGVVAYAGAPVRTAAGDILGALCVIDARPRVWTNDDAEVLLGFAALVSAEIETHARQRREHLAMQEFVTAERAFKAFMEHCPAVAYIKDTDSRHVYVNRTMTRYFGEDARHWVGKLETEIFGPEVAARFAANDRLTLASPDGLEFEETTPMPDGSESTWITYKFPIDLPDGRRLVGGMSIDITERKRAEREMARLRGAAEAASLAKSRFLAHMSHELRTPLTSIVGYADLLCLPEITPSDRHRHASTIRRNADHLLAVLNDVLDVSKIEAGRMGVERLPTDLPRVAGEVIASLRPRAEGKGLWLRVVFDSPVPATFSCDPTRLRQMLINLIGNAVKFTHAGGVTVRLSHGGGAVRVAIEDTGIGMTPQQIGGLFQSFTQGDSSHTRLYGGTGLGLAISRQLARLLGGDITVASEAGVGSTFTLALPAGDTAATATASVLPRDAPPPALPPAVVGTRGRVLLAEDGVDSQWLISAYLQRAGADVRIVDNGRHAIEAATTADADGAPFDLILMDCQMPDLDGISATRRLREIGYRRPIVALTANAMPHEREACLAAGCCAFLGKPIETDLFFATVARYLPAPEAAGGREPAVVSTRASDPVIGPLVEPFLIDLKRQIDALSRAARGDDLPQVRRLAHQIKGAAGSYGFPAITTAAADIESATRGERLDAFDDLLGRLTDLCERATR